MENFDQIFILLTENSFVSLNPDILETGVINIIALVAILIYAGRDFLGSILETRKTIIVKSIQDAEDRLTEAEERLVEAQNQLNQASLVMEEIKNETIASKKLLLEAAAYQSKNDLEVRFARAFATIRSKEQQVFLEIKQKIISLVLERTLLQAQQTFTLKSRASELIDETINKLEGNLI